MSSTEVTCKSTSSSPKQPTKLNRLSQTCKGNVPLKRKKSQEQQIQREAGSPPSFPFRGKSDKEKLKNQNASKNRSHKTPPQGYLQVQANKTNCADTVRRKPSINPEIRRVAPKTDIWQRKNVEISSKLANAKTTKYVSPYRKSQLVSVTAKPKQNDLKPADGRRPVLKMPANIPKASKRKHRYVITVIGSEIKLLEPKPKSLRSDTSRLQLPVFNNGATVSIRAEKLAVPKRRGKKEKDPENSKKETDKKCKEPMKNAESSKTVLKVMQHENDRENSVSCDVDSTVARLNLSGDLVGKKVVKFSDRRTKIYLVEKPSCLTEDVSLLEKLDPISNILNIEYVDSVQKCQEITDFLEPTENPNPPVLSKRIFRDTTMMEELNFPPLLSSDLTPHPVDLPFVPKFLPEDVKRTLSWPMMVPVKSEVRHHPMSSHQKKRRPKLETILATRPKGYHHAKWLEKTVASDSHLKTKLLRDVIISQVKKLLKRQAEVRNRTSEKNLHTRGSEWKITLTNKNID